MKAVALTSVLFALGCAVPRSASAQVSPAEIIGSRIRVYRLTEPTKIGTLMSRENDLLVVQWLKGSQDTIPTSVITKLEISRGKRRFARNGAFVGLVTGAGIGLILKAVNDGDRGQNEEPTPSRLVPTAAISGTVLGALLGAMGTDDWRTVPLGRPRRVGLVGTSAHRRFGLEITRPF